MLTNFLSIFIKFFPKIYELLISYLIYVSLALATIDKRIEFSWACSSHNFQKQYSNSHKVFHISNTWNTSLLDRILSYHIYFDIPLYLFSHYKISNISIKELILFLLTHLLRNKKNKYLILIARCSHCSHQKIVQLSWKLWCLSLYQQIYIVQFHS